MRVMLRNSVTRKCVRMRSCVCVCTRACFCDTVCIVVLDSSNYEPIVDFVMSQMAVSDLYVYVL